MTYSKNYYKQHRIYVKQYQLNRIHAKRYQFKARDEYKKKHLNNLIKKDTIRMNRSTDRKNAIDQKFSTVLIIITIILILFMGFASLKLMA